MERNKLQLPLLTHIALLFILAALVATIGVWLFSRRYWIESAAEQADRPRALLFWPEWLLPTPTPIF